MVVGRAAWRVPNLINLALTMVAWVWKPWETSMQGAEGTMMTLTEHLKTS